MEVHQISNVKSNMDKGQKSASKLRRTTSLEDNDEARVYILAQ